MRKSLSATLLLLVLCCPASAGDMLTPPAAPPPPAPAIVAAGSGNENADPAPVIDATEGDISMTEVALSILESLLAIL